MNRNKRKLILIACSIALLLTAAVGSTVAFLIDSTETVENTFSPSKVVCRVDESLNGTTKSNVKITNVQGDDHVDAYIRAAVIITWKNSAGAVYGEKPIEGKHYNVTGLGSGWETFNGFYYWPSIVKVGESTGNLIGSISPTGTRPEDMPDEYQLNVEILAQAIQASGMGVNSAKDAFDKAAQ